MALRIGERIEDIRREIEKGNSSLADELARLGVKAMFAGIGTFDEETRVYTNITPEWIELMENFAHNQTELDRLCGKDREFNDSEWGKVCLAYICGDSTCTAPTARKGGTSRSMKEEPLRRMLETLDAERDDLPEFSKNAPFLDRTPDDRA
jgi:hypothetical protein